MSGSYCRYYSIHVIVVTTVVTTVVTENCVPTHAIFILMSDVRCRAPFLRKKSSFMDDDSNNDDNSSNDNNSNDDDDSDDDDTKVHAALPGAKEQPAKRQWSTFTRVCRCPCNSRNVSGVHSILSHCRNPSKPRVSQAVGVRSCDGSGEMRL